MDLSALVLNQSQSDSLKLSGKAPEIEGKAEVKEGFLQTLSEYLNKVESIGLSEPSEIVSELAVDLPETLSLTGNELPVQSETATAVAGFYSEESSVAGAIPVEKLEAILESQAVNEADVDDVLSVFLSGLPGGFKSGMADEQLNTTAETPSLFKTAKEESLLLKAVSDFLQEKGVKGKATIEASSLTALKASASQLADNKEPFSSSLASLNATASQAVTGKEQLPAMSRPLGHPEWGRELGERINWMASKTVQTAELRLNPARLGPVEVHVQVNHDQASVMFSSPHAAVREALEQALPRLREMMTAQQFEQVNVDISHQSFDDKQTFQNGSNDFGENSSLPTTGEDSGEAETTVSSRVITGEGLLSYYV